MRGGCSSSFARAHFAPPRVVSLSFWAGVMRSGTTTMRWSGGFGLRPCPRSFGGRLGWVSVVMASILDKPLLGHAQAFPAGGDDVVQHAHVHQSQGGFEGACLKPLS